MKAQLFAAIADELKAKLPELAWIDWDWGQLEVPTENYPLQFDCCLISFPGTEWQTGQKKVQYGRRTIRFRFAVDMYEDTHVADGITAPDRALAMQKMQLEERAFAILQGFSGELFGPLMRVADSEERRDDGIKVFVQDYVTEVTEIGAAKQWATVENPGLMTVGDFQSV